MRIPDKGPSTSESEYTDRLDMREQLARIDRSLIETQKLAAQARKFAAEQNKLSAEQLKPFAETANLRVTRFVTPVAAVVAALGALTAAAPVLVRWWQDHP